MAELHGTQEMHPEQLVADPALLDPEFWSHGIDRQEALNNLALWLHEEINRAKMTRGEVEDSWEENMRMYEGIPKMRERNTPIENAPNLEVPLGAIACDAIYAQIVNLIFNVSPVVTVSPTDETGALNDAAKALQRLADVLANSQIGLRPAANNSILDDVKLGTGVYYIRWRQRVKVTTAREVTEHGPHVRALPIEDFFVPGGAYDNIQELRWVAMRTWLTHGELRIRALDQGWDIEGVQSAGNVDRVRQARERIGRHSGDADRKASDDAGGGDIYEVFDIYILFDINGDGKEEDLLVTFDFTGRHILKWRFNPYTRRPFEVMRYQNRSFTFYGLGVIEMLRTFQEGATEVWNHWVLNSMLANARFWAAKHGALGNTTRFYPNKVVQMSDPKNDIAAIQMADVYPSGPAALNQVINFAERRSGINDLTAPRPSAVLGSRTPGITALSMLQKSNERFGPAFDSARVATAGAVKQALFRIQERLMAADPDAEQYVINLLDEEAGRAAIEALRDENFDNSYDIELTASSARVNREVERQNSLTLLQTLMSYYEKVLMLTQVAATPQLPPPVKEVAMQIAEKMGEIVDRTIRTFDQIKDPAAFVITVTEELDQLAVAADPLQQLLASIPQGGEGGGEPEPGAAVGEQFAAGIPGA
jgi:hypothetical protein